jgi:hypothetical protein
VCSYLLHESLKPSAVQQEPISAGPDIGELSKHPNQLSEELFRTMASLHQTFAASYSLNTQLSAASQDLETSKGRLTQHMSQVSLSSYKTMSTSHSSNFVTNFVHNISSEASGNLFSVQKSVFKCRKLLITNTCFLSKSARESTEDDLPFKISTIVSNDSGCI